jgi:N-acetylmuramoyl-L-alanine amidase
MVVLHYTAMQTPEAACARLCDEVAEVSAHYLISETGEITQLVAENMRAWHAGAGAWGCVRDVNSHSIGIELANATNTEAIPFSNLQMDALEGLLAGILERWSISATRVIGHSDMAPARKFDPGGKFDWRRLALGGLSVWPDLSSRGPSDWDVFQNNAEVFGYRSSEDNEQGWAQVLSAFRLRFMPNKTGALDEQDVGVITYLAQHWPCRDVDLTRASV